MHIFGTFSEASGCDACHLVGLSLQTAIRPLADQVTESGVLTVTLLS